MSARGKGLRPWAAGSFAVAAAAHALLTLLATPETDGWRRTVGGDAGHAMQAAGLALLAVAFLRLDRRWAKALAGPGVLLLAGRLLALLTPDDLGLAGIGSAVGFLGVFALLLFGLLALLVVGVPAVALAWAAGRGGAWAPRVLAGGLLLATLLFLGFDAGFRAPLVADAAVAVGNAAALVGLLLGAAHLWRVRPAPAPREPI